MIVTLLLVWRRNDNYCMWEREHILFSTGGPLPSQSQKGILLRDWDRRTVLGERRGHWARADKLSERQQQHVLQTDEMYCRM
jgi:hypothetical protein